MMTIKYDDIYVVESLEEANQFRYEHDDQPLALGTAVGHNVYVYTGDTPDMFVEDADPRGHDPGQLTRVELRCFDGVYYSDDTDTPGQMKIQWPGDFDGAHHVANIS